MTNLGFCINSCRRLQAAVNMQWDLRLFVSKLQKIEVAIDRRADIIRINILY